jgi:dTDP-4-amino-4,6-dideoxygalactose transaminase
MHLRINIPAWGYREYLYLVKSLTTGHGGSFSHRLVEALSSFATGRTCLLTGSARLALVLAIKAQGRANPRVAVPAYICPAVVTAVRTAGAQPVFVDVAPDSVRFDASALLRVLQAGEADFVIAPNTYGLDQDFQVLKGLNVPVIEDAAYQAGLRDPFNGQPCGLRCSWGVWSFNYKALTGLGGGVLFSSVPIHELVGKELLEPVRPNWRRLLDYFVRSLLRCRIPRFLPGAGEPKTQHPEEVREVLCQVPAGSLNEIQAALALAQWERREVLQARVQQHARLIGQALAQCPGLARLETDACPPPPHLFPVLVTAGHRNSPDLALALRKELHRRSIQTDDPYPVTAGGHEQYPRAHELAARLVLLPCGAWLRESEMARLAGALELAWRSVVTRGT